PGHPRAGRGAAGPPADPHPRRPHRKRHRMRLTESFRVALEALRVNRLRSALTMFGVIIGVSAVVVLVAIGTGAKNLVQNQIEGLGSNIIFVVPGKFTLG